MIRLKCMNYLPDKLASLRKHYNYSQKHLAKVLNIDIVEYMGIENGRTVLNNEQISKLANFYHIDYIELFRNDDFVTMYEVDNQDTDQINIEYFIPKSTFINKTKKFIRNHKLGVGIGIGFVLFAFLCLIIPSFFKTPVENKIYDKNTLSVSNRTVLYLNESGTVRGSGDNSSSQLSNLPADSVVKVCANDFYSVFLLNDGTLSVCGDCGQTLKESIEKVKDATDLAIGDNHIVILKKDKNVMCLGDNSFKQCEINGVQKISQIFAGKNASVVIDENGNVTSSGEFIGRSTISDIKNIVDIDFSDTTLVFLKDDGTVDYATNLNGKYYMESWKWSNVKDIACGQDFIVGLMEDGTVSVACNNATIKEEVMGLKNIIAIDASDKYFIAYDGDSIYGFGENRYNQFISINNASFKLSEVTNPTVECYKDLIMLSFDQVNNAASYEIVFNDSVQQYTNNINITLDASDIPNQSSCKLTITALGDGYLLDSDPVEFEFEYKYNEEQKVERVTISTLLDQMSKEEIDAYLSQMGINSVVSHESDQICSGDRITISDITGISSGATYNKEDLKNIHVEYNYCKLQLEENNEENLENPE